MKLNKKYQIEKAASSDPTWFVITNIHIAEDRKHLVATDGRMLAIVPVELDKKDDRGSGAIAPSVIIDARKKARRSDDLFISMNGTFQHVDGMTAPRISAEDAGVYPNYLQLIPKDPAIKNKVTLNPEMLLSLARALGDSKSITLEFQDVSGHPAIIARNGDAIGLLMPLSEAR